MFCFSICCGNSISESQNYLSCLMGCHIAYYLYMYAYNVSKMQVTVIYTKIPTDNKLYTLKLRNLIIIFKMLFYEHRFEYIEVMRIHTLSYIFKARIAVYIICWFFLLFLDINNA